ncbi:hypothetical protein V7068_21265, partial [Bacillus sp. JJ634]
KALQHYKNEWYLTHQLLLQISLYRILLPILASIIEKSEIDSAISLFFISEVGFVPAPKTF